MASEQLKTQERRVHLTHDTRSDSSRIQAKLSTVRVVDRSNSSGFEKQTLAWRASRAILDHFPLTYEFYYCRRFNWYRQSEKF